MRHYQQLSRAERHVIQKMSYSDISKTDIAEYLERHHSTIYRELKRNRTHNYKYEEAQNKSDCRRNKRKRKLDKCGILRLITVSLLLEKYSPEIIAYYLRESFPDNSTMHLSHEAIYQWIYQQPDKTLSLNLFTRRKKRQNRSKIYKNRDIHPVKKNIKDRPVEAQEKSEPGHLEGDLIVSTNQDAYALTLADRKTMHLWGLPVHSKDPEEVCRAVVEALDYLPSGFIKTITFDNGSEFNSYQLIENALGCKVYFADPYSAWQRGLNEHLNGRIRQYLPKKKSFSGLTDEKYEDILHNINSRPRKSRNWNSPISLLEEYLLAFDT